MARQRYVKTIFTLEVFPCKVRLVVWFKNCLIDWNQKLKKEGEEREIRWLNLREREAKKESEKNDRDRKRVLNLL